MLMRKEEIMPDDIRELGNRALRKKLIRLISEKIEMLKSNRELNIELNDYSGIEKIEKKLEFLREELKEVSRDKWVNRKQVGDLDKHRFVSSLK